MLYPFTPHITFVLWQALGAKDDIDHSTWPIGDKSALIEHTKTIIVQINGKTRDKIDVLNNTQEHTVRNLVLQKNSTILKYLKNKKIKKTIYIQNKLINLVTEEEKKVCFVH